MIESKSKFYNSEVSDEMKQVLELQIEFIKGIIGEKYSSINEIYCRVIKELNFLSLSKGFKGLI